jgi:hypothetical protein
VPTGTCGAGMVGDEHRIGSNRPHHLAGQGHGPTPAHHAHPITCLRAEHSREVGMDFQEWLRILPHQGARPPGQVTHNLPIWTCLAGRRHRLPDANDTAFGVGDSAFVLFLWCRGRQEEPRGWIIWSCRVGAWCAALQWRCGGVLHRETTVAIQEGGCSTQTQNHQVQPHQAPDR